MAFPKTLNTGDPAAVHRFIGGRRNYNSCRQFARALRWQKLITLWAKNPRAKKAELARDLGVHRSTVCRDIKAILAESQKLESCPICGHKYRPDLVREDEIAETIPHAPGR